MARVRLLQGAPEGYEGSTTYVRNPFIIVTDDDSALSAFDGTLCPVRESLRAPNEAKLDFFAAWLFRTKRFSITMTGSASCSYSGPIYATGRTGTFTQSSSYLWVSPILFDRAQLDSGAIDPNEYGYYQSLSASASGWQVAFGGSPGFTSSTSASYDPGGGMPIVPITGSDESFSVVLSSGSGKIIQTIIAAVTQLVLTNEISIGCGFLTEGPTVGWDAQMSCSGATTKGIFGDWNTEIGTITFKWKLHGGGETSIVIPVWSSAESASDTVTVNSGGTGGSLDYPSGDSGAVLDRADSSRTFSMVIEAAETFLYGVDPEDPLALTESNALWNDDGTRAGALSVDDIMRADLVSP